MCVVMPAWNEAEGITSFLRELNTALVGCSPRFIVVDDCSTDGTAEVVRSLAAERIEVQAHEQPHNAGHGPSTLRALRLGLESGSAIIVATDGDGQFVGSDVRRVVDELQQRSLEVVEGARTQRTDPGYRALVSTITRILVGFRAHKFPADANTPLRAYTRDALQKVLQRLPGDVLTPNLMISAICRANRMALGEVQVRSLPRRGKNATGTSWGRSLRGLPSKRFVVFCLRATREWFTLRPR